MEQLIMQLYNVFENMADNHNRTNGYCYYDYTDERKIKNDLTVLSNELKNIYPFFSEQLFRLKDYLFMSNGTLNMSTYGETRMILKALEDDFYHKGYLGFWAYIHPIIIDVSQKLFIDKHYSKAVQAAFVEINARVKNIRKKIDGKEFDGDTLMRQTFSVNQPILFFEDNSTESGKNTQQGYMDIFAGVMKGIRNPNAHENKGTTKDDALRKLMLASLLMYKVDEAIKYSEIAE